MTMALLNSVSAGARSSRWDHLAAIWRQAAAMIEAYPDEAALLLDGMLRRIVEEWWLSRELAPKDAAAMLRLVDRHEPLFGWRLRLALRAPSSHARLEHCAALLAMLSVADQSAPGDCEENAHDKFVHCIQCGELGGGVSHA